MIKPLKVLLIDDHPLIIEAYKNTLKSYFNFSKNLLMEEALNCDTAIKKLKQRDKDNYFDLVFLDINIPSKNKSILNGFDLGKKIVHSFKDTKIIVITSHFDNYFIQNVLDNIKPNGFLIKSDISQKDIVYALESVLNKNSFYSNTVLNFFKKKIETKVNLDKLDRHILYELSMGTKTKDLPEIVPLSLGGIERRKRQLKILFNIESCNDKILVQKAKKMGVI